MQLLNRYTQHMLSRFKFIFTATAFPTEEELGDQFKDWNSASVDRLNELKEKLDNVGSEIGGTHVVYDRFITDDLIKALDNAFIDTLTNQWQVLGTMEASYYGEFVKYRQQVIEIFRKHAASQKPDGAQESLVVNLMVSRATYVLHQTSRGFIGFLPFITPSLIPFLRDWLHQVRHAIQEVSLTFHNRHLHSGEHRSESMSGAHRQTCRCGGFRLKSESAITDVLVILYGPRRCPALTARHADVAVSDLNRKALSQTSW
jgi:hypothetical protein